MKSQRFLEVRRAARAGALGVALALGLGLAPSAQAQKVYESPDAAMSAFGDAVNSQDEEAMKVVLGSNFRELIPPVGADIRERFLAAWAKEHKVEINEKDKKRADIEVGGDGWTLPIPLVKGAKGWAFDLNKGVEVMRIRRVGRNELAVMQTMLALYDAQRDYVQYKHDDNTTYVYASKLVSSPGKHDGLYWPTAAGEPQSPVGPAFVEAREKEASDEGYHGYHYKLLTAQGKHAPGGAYDYLVNGKLFGGFAAIAWPVDYLDTGVKSFMVSHDGQVFERDLGPKTADVVKAMKTFDPGPGWTKVQP
jgi:hypothetical protein